MRVLVTGSNGQLGKEVIRQFSQDHTVIGYGKEELDITNQPQVTAICQRDYPDLIIHTAAYTAVDECETNAKMALEINAIGSANVAKAAKKIGARMFYISTDYVFNGEKEQPYIETDQVFPLSMYGLSKLAGELMVEILVPDCAIIRTSWLYGHGGENFVNTMLNFAKKNKAVRVVNDQVGSPTYTADLVKVLLKLIDKPNGIYHVSNSGACSWFQFAQTIYREAGSNPQLVIPCTTNEYGAVAKRPKYSVMAHNKLEKQQIDLPRNWEDALKEFIRKEITND